MVVCGECVVIPNCYRYTMYFSKKRDTCCKCKNYKEYVLEVKFYDYSSKTWHKSRLSSD